MAQRASGRVATGFQTAQAGAVNLFNDRTSPLVDGRHAPMTPPGSARSARCQVDWIGMRRMRGRFRPAAMMLGILALAGCVEPARQVNTGTAGQPFPIAMTIASGQARMPLSRGTRALAGPVGADGGLDAIRWQGDRVATEASSGRVTANGCVLDCRYDWPQAHAVGCAFRYEGRRLA